MNLAELHLHLDGSLRRETLRELARPGDDVDVAFHAGMGLQAALDCFRTTLSVLQTAVSALYPRLRFVDEELQDVIADEPRAEG